MLQPKLVSLHGVVKLWVFVNFGTLCSRVVFYVRKCQTVHVSCHAGSVRVGVYVDVVLPASLP